MRAIVCRVENCIVSSICLFLSGQVAPLTSSSSTLLLLLRLLLPLSVAFVPPAVFHRRKRPDRPTVARTDGPTQGATYTQQSDRPSDRLCKEASEQANQPTNQPTKPPAVERTLNVVSVASSYREPKCARPLLVAPWRPTASYD